MRCRDPEWHEVLASTNVWLVARLRAGEALASGYVVAARQQTAGRGRQGRGWVSGPGDDLTFSVVVPAAGEPRSALSAPMAAVLGVAAAVERVCGLEPRVKWPNDLLLDGRKLCGVLGERVGEALVVGIGLNVNMPAALAARIDRPATSLSIATGRRYELSRVFEQVSAGLDEWLTRWEEGGFAAIRASWTRRCAFLGDGVWVRVGARPVHGRLTGFGEHGQALLAQADGKLLEVWAGELSRNDRPG
jgi:BirA family transcriptional regulator, biotin operon repressor / biotin---[acetyl-CoA-carboxylase] ligase